MPYFQKQKNVFVLVATLNCIKFIDDADDEDENKNGIMHDEFFKSTWEKRNEKIRYELDQLEAEQVGEKMGIKDINFYQFNVFHSVLF